MAENRDRDLYRALTTVVGITVTVFAAMSGAATVSYVVGYLNRKMYLSVFGAGWALSELGAAEVLIASFPTIALLIVALGLGFQGVTTRRPSWARLKNVYGAYALGMIIIALDFAGADRLLYDTRAILYDTIACLALFIAVALARRGFVALFEHSIAARYAAVNNFALAIIAGCVLLPSFMGISEGLAACGNRFRDLPTVVITPAGSERLALLAASSARVYCLKWSESGDIRVFPVLWRNVVSITSKRR